MFLVPVLDLLQGRAVRAVAGRRESYRPLEPQSDPVELARRFACRWQLRHLYVADLDAIASGNRRWSLYQQLHRVVPQLWLDLGIRHRDDLHQVARPLAGLSPPPQLVLALETLECPGVLEELGDCWPPDRLIFSLDLREGRPLGSPAWPRDPLAVAHLAWQAGLRRLILLDLADVGTGQGVSTLPLWRRIQDRWPSAQGILGGGVASPEQLRRLEQCGVHAVLVASILHREVLRPQQVMQLGWTG